MTPNHNRLTAKYIKSFINALWCGNSSHCYACAASDKPVFTTSTSPYTVSVLEHQPAVIINVTAVANPANVSYNWSSGSLRLNELVASGPLLTLGTVTRRDAGSFTCSASNSEGSSTLTVILDVQCMNTSYKPLTRPYSSPSLPSLSPLFFRLEVVPQIQLRDLAERC